MSPSTPHHLRRPRRHADVLPVRQRRREDGVDAPRRRRQIPSGRPGQHGDGSPRDRAGAGDEGHRASARRACTPQRLHVRHTGELRHHDAGDAPGPPLQQLRREPRREPPEPDAGTQVAYSLFMAKTSAVYNVGWIGDSYDGIVLPALGPLRRSIVQWGIKFVGYPYVYAGEWGLARSEPSALGGQPVPGFDCSGCRGGCCARATAGTGTCLPRGRTPDGRFPSVPRRTWRAPAI